ncbi:MAG: hypothetical protein EXR79_16465 [Myxococcales bacterium]|nr:hypothetical protein [Myxococcales bacterium]
MGSQSSPSVRVLATGGVPPALRTWFAIHFVADLLFAVPMFVAPHATLHGLFGWETVDPIATRLVAAALFGIGIESWLGRHNGVEGFRTMLTLKVIWATTAWVGILWSLLENGGRPIAGWLFFGVFLGFASLWSYWRWRLHTS